MRQPSSYEHGGAVLSLVCREVPGIGDSYSPLPFTHCCLQQAREPTLLLTSCSTQESKLCFMPGKNGIQLNRSEGHDHWESGPTPSAIWWCGKEKEMPPTLTLVVGGRDGPEVTRVE